MDGEGLFPGCDGFWGVFYGFERDKIGRIDE